MEQKDPRHQRKISRQLSHTLDCLGYSQKMVQKRQQFYREYDFSQSCNVHKYITSVSVGSRPEGAVKWHETDFDHLDKSNYMICVRDQYGLKYFSQMFTMFLLVPCLFHPGHFQLVLKQLGNIDERLLTCLKLSPRGLVFSSKYFLSLFKGRNKDKNNKNFLEIFGPALSISSEYLDHDTVISFPCACPDILHKWLSRPRNYNWPPSDLRLKISKMTGNIVANAINGCDDEDVEWRLCFNEIELLIVQSWNDTQTKLYKLLKMIKSDILKPQQKEITSYLLKNVVFWLSERYPQSAFRHGNLFDWIIKALRLLKRAVRKRYLPYYMIPERNLLVERIQKSESKRIAVQIRRVLQSGEDLLLNCKKIAFAMGMNPTDLVRYKEKSDLVETVSMQFELYEAAKETEEKLLGASTYETTEDRRACGIFIHRLINSQWPPAVQEKLNHCKDSGEKIALLLS